MKLSRLIGLFTFVFSLSLQVNAATWTLDNDKSSLNFVSIKKGSIGELHHFKNLDGNISDDGKVAVEIDLNSVETNIPIRNERMQKMLFNTAKFPQSTIVLQTDETQINGLKTGEQLIKKVNATLSLAGITKTVKTQVLVTKLSASLFSVSSVAPVLINASEYNLSAGIEALQKIAGLPSITTSVPVTFNFYFSK